MNNLSRDFSDRFDSLMNSYSQKVSFGDQSTVPSLDFDEYEKSLFLTQAQHDIVVGYYNGMNTRRESFEQTEEMRRYLANLICTARLHEENQVSCSGIEDYSVVFQLPEKCMFITYEAVKLASDNPCLNNKVLEVVPVAQDEYHDMKNNPFRGPEGRAFRLDTPEGLEIICKDSKISEYIVRYIKRPEPIILVNLPSDMNIEGKNVESICELDPSIHNEIIERAVLLALNSRVRTSK